MIEKQQELFSCEDTDKKQQLLEQIETLRDAIIRQQLQGANPETMAHYEEARTAASKPYVLWQLEFARVFREKGGFDVCMGNPPYIQLQKTIDEETREKLGDQYSSVGFETFAKTGDIYCLFYEKGFRLLHENGILAFITSNKWMRAGYGEKLRAFFAKRTNPLTLIDFAGQRVFESATVDVNILIFSKEANSGCTNACIAKENCAGNLSVYVRREAKTTAFTSSNSWVIMNAIEASIKRKMEERGTPLREWNISINRGILTGLNEAFIVSGEVKDQLILKDPKSAEIIRPILRGRDIKRYAYSHADLWLIATFPSRHYDINDYPAVRDYLLSFGMERLEQTGTRRIVNGEEVHARKKTSNEWFETQDSISYWDDFSKTKIMYNDICQRLSFCIVPPDVFCVNTVYFIKDNPHLKFLLACLNSNIINWYYRTLSVQLGEKAVRMFSIYVENIPIPMPPNDVEQEINALVDIVVTQQGNDRESAEKRIELIIASLYGLTDEEISFVSSYTEQFY